MSKLCVLINNDCYSDILNEFQEVTTPCINKCRLLGQVEHHIDTRCRRPVFVGARRLSPDKESNKLLEMDVIQPSISPSLVVTASHGGETVQPLASLRRLQSAKCSFRG